MAEVLDKAKENLIQELGRLTSFAGFNKVMGHIYGLLYLSPEPVSLDEIAGQLGISKGNASLNIRAMVRWGLLQPVSKKGDRRDYYQAETDFWKIIRDILTGRDKKEIDHILNAISDILASVSATERAGQSSESRFYQERLGNMLDFGNTINQIAKTFLAMDNLRAGGLMRRGPGKDSP
jgi:DNA-binding transcriptional regulator GbsR (MarR family)